MTGAMIGHPAPLRRGVRSSNHDRSRDRRDGWVGLSSWPQRLEASLGWKAQTNDESEMALFFECMLQCAQKVLDAADIVRDGDLSSTTRSTAHESRKSAIASRTFCSDCFHFQQGPRVQSPLTDLRWALLAVGAIPDGNCVRV